MAGFDFGSIGPIVGEYMDTDLIDIYRQILITLPDGSTASTDPNIPYIEGAPCHISFERTPNPDPATAGSSPILVTLTINCSIDIDLQNADRVVVRKMSHGGEELEGYTGTIGMPITVQSRKEAIMVARQTV